MKILNVNFSDTSGGAARAAYRLHMGLNDSGIDSKMLVQRKYSSDPTVEACYGESKLGFVYSSLRSSLDRLITKLQHSTNPITHNANWLPSGLHKQINRSNADIIQIHWIGGGMLTIREIAKIEKPIVWILHDMWAFSGAEHYDDLDNSKRYKKGYYFNNRPNEYKGLDIDRWTWKRKMKHWSDKDIKIVTPSNWLANCVRESPLFENKKVSVIPYTLDLDIYKPIPKSWAHSILNIQQGKDKKYILFGALSPTSDERKGFIQLQKATNLLKDKNYELLVFGTEGHENIEFGLPTKFLGRLNDDETLTLAYSAADVMIVPSLQDNLPNTAVESVACGTPVVAFNVGGLPDIVDHKQNGYLAKPYSQEDLATGIRWVLENEDRNKKLAIQARNNALQKFALDKVALQYFKLYRSILD